MMKVIVLLGMSFALFSCNQKKTESPATPVNPGTKEVNTELMDKVIDTIAHFENFPLSRAEDRSDPDDLLPVGYSDDGSFAYFILEDMGGALAVNFNISSTYEVFSVKAGFGMDQDLDTVLAYHKPFIYHALLDGKIHLKNKFRKLSLDSLKQQYGFKFDNISSYGPADPDDGSKRKLLKSVKISYRRNDEPTVDVKDETFSPSESVYDKFIVDCIAVPGRDGDVGFLVVLTESRGFEGYVRKSLEVVPIGVLETKE